MKLPPAINQNLHFIVPAAVMAFMGLGSALLPWPIVLLVVVAAGAVMYKKLDTREAKPTVKSTEDFAAELIAEEERKKRAKQTIEENSKKKKERKSRARAQQGAGRKKESGRKERATPAKAESDAEDSDDDDLVFLARQQMGGDAGFRQRHGAHLAKLEKSNETKDEPTSSSSKSRRRKNKSK